MTIVSCAHVALHCRDAQKTVDFYQGILGLEMTIADRVVGHRHLGPDCNYLHLFFKLGDGNFIAFFDTPDVPFPSEGANRLIFDHYAYFAANSSEVDGYKQRLENAGTKVDGPIVRPPFHSIYFKDPNGYHMEITSHIPTDSVRYEEDAAKASRVLAQWNADKSEGLLRSKPVGGTA